MIIRYSINKRNPVPIVILKKKNKKTKNQQVEEGCSVIE
jgi:hypothetical protein